MNRVVHSVPFTTEVKEKVCLYLSLLLLFLGSNLPFSSEMSETHSVSIHHADDRCDGNRCPECSNFRQDGISVVLVRDVRII